MNQFVEPTISDIESGETVTFSKLIDELQHGKKYVLTAEYGVGKSMVLRHLFYGLIDKVRKKTYFRTPIAINLREHLGQTEPIELLERHARLNASEPQKLVAAWNAGYVDLLIDGFDELSTRGWTGDIRRLKEYKRASHSVVRKLVKDTQNKCGICITGREGYFDSISEMREALGVDSNKFRICRILSFDERQTSDFVRKLEYKGVTPDWLPTRPLLLHYLLKKNLLDAAVRVNVSGELPRGASWIQLIEMIAKRESEQLEGVDQETLINFLGALAVHARHSSGSPASFSPQFMELLFTNVAGVAIMEDERNLLLRLPGLGADQDSSLNRSFVDSDFMNVCCSFPILSYIRDPYTERTNLYKFDGLAEPMSDIGIESLASLLIRSKVNGGAIYAAVDHAIKMELYQLAFDIFRAAQKIALTQRTLVFYGISVNELDLTNDDYDIYNLTFSGCVIDRVVLSIPEETNLSIVFSDCLIGRVEGRMSRSDLNSDQFLNCEIAEFSDEYSVNNKILDSSLPLGVRILIVTLKKIFTQGGSGRLESALYRGMDQRSRLIVPEVINLLRKYSFVTENDRRGKTTFFGTKSKRQEALAIIQSPNSVSYKILNECRILT